MQIIHSNSAKVWVLENNIIANEESTPQTRDFKTAFIFYNNGVFLEQKTVHLGSNKGQKGVYSLIISQEEKDTILNLNYKNKETKIFRLVYCSSQELKLQKAEENFSKKNNFWILKTLPKPSKWY